MAGPAEAFRSLVDYYAHAPHTSAVLEKLAQGTLDSPAVVRAGAKSPLRHS